MKYIVFLLDLIPNGVESLLLLYLISHCLQLRSFWNQKWPFVILQFSLVTLLSNTISIVLVKSILLFAINLLLVVIITDPAPITSKIFYGSLFAFFTFLSEKISIFSSEYIIGYSLEQIDTYSITRYWLTFLYLLLLFLFTFLAVKLIKKNLQFPKVIFAATMLGIPFAIFVSEVLLHNILSLEIKGDYNTRSLQFTGIGFLVLILLFFFLILYLGKLYDSNLLLLEQQQQTELEQKQLETMKQANESLRSWKHDFQNNLQTLAQLTHNENANKSEAYIQDLLGELQFINYGVYTYNAAIDSILSIKFWEIENKPIQFSHEIYFSAELKTPLSDVKLASILGNILDNAIDACNKINEDTFIKFSMKTYHSQLIIEVVNSSNGTYKYNSKGDFITTKTEKNHGHGLKRVRALVREASGICNIKPEKDCFYLTILLPIDS